MGVFSLTVAGLELLDADSTHPKMAGEFANAPTLLSGLTDEFGAPSSESRGGLIGALSNGGDLVADLTDLSDHVVLLHATDCTALPC